jgi:hypothetical protein
MGRPSIANELVTKAHGEHPVLLRDAVLEPERRFELLTCALRVRCSTD